MRKSPTLNRQYRNLKAWIAWQEEVEKRSREQVRGNSVVVTAKDLSMSNEEITEKFFRQKAKDLFRTSPT